MDRHIYLVDLNEDMTAAWRREFAQVPDVTVSRSNIKTWYNKADTFVSASNSKLFFDGGSDLAYQKMFPNVDHIMQVWVKQYGFRDLFGDSFLPVGAATIRPFRDRKLICCPTMLLPQDVSKTRNAYHCFKLILELIDKYSDVREVVVPGLCCGYGSMPYSVCAQQMRQAYADHLAEVRKLDLFAADVCTLVHNPELIRLQPKYYQNSQFFKFDPSETVRVPK